MQGMCNKRVIPIQKILWHGILAFIQAVPLSMKMEYDTWLRSQPAFIYE